ncbi:aminoglycoside phosphotransferase family protein [Anaerocolumna sp. MB42-C2]|uniref:aminoglycoside phosphotransferase family protein n=1 Tax=Anaerocolumna sp. MB42-C2 TaxID=3070997 RepID=UPI0027DF9F4F|nr:aminoglycoside phosphotransferase family protein [Anaerocolumna sp. MB42-C2]WMJ86304.1 aminoglycoside phosphotransferase family protein [Anaerocolumna sp. MB42-C2]
MSQGQRIYSFYNINKNMVCEMFKTFDNSIVTKAVTPIHSGMSTSNYCIADGQREYLLKIYSGHDGNIEPVIYEYLQKHIRIPALYYYDDSRKICPYPYAIMEYIHGVTLSEHIRRNCCYSTEIVYEIGRMLSIIHKKNYLKSGFLDRELYVIKPCKSTEEFIFSMLEGRPGARLSVSVCDSLKVYLKKNHDILHRIDCEFVLCHGDMGYGNILISDDNVYFIDFEYAMAESRYRDIGKFFRNKAPDVQQYISTNVYKAFTEGYNGLPSDWLQLAKVADIPVMLGLLNVDTAPQEWVDDMEHDIMEVIK